MRALPPAHGRRPGRALPQPGGRPGDVVRLVHAAVARLLPAAAPHSDSATAGDPETGDGGPVPAPQHRACLAVPACFTVPTFFTVPASLAVPAFFTVPAFFPVPACLAVLAFFPVLPASPCLSASPCLCLAR